MSKTPECSRTIRFSTKSSASGASTASRSGRANPGVRVLILDTDLLTVVQRGTGDQYETLVGRLDAADDLVCVTIISFEEQIRGWLAYISRAKHVVKQLPAYARLRQLIDDFSTRPILDFDARALDHFDEFRKRKLRVGTMDLKIAAIVVANGATLLSPILRDFRAVPGLRVEDWASDT